MSADPDLSAKLRTIPTHPRRRPPRMVDGRLSVAWASTRSEGADIYVVGGDGTCGPDRRLVLGAFCNEPLRMRFRDDGRVDHVKEKSLAEELIDRGYDITTLRFSIDRLPQSPPPVPQIQHPPASADSQQHGDDGEDGLGEV